jgi:hypothetical protein
MIEGSSTKNVRYMYKNGTVKGNLMHEYPADKGKEKFAWQVACLHALISCNACNCMQLHATTYNAHKPENQLLTRFLIIYTQSR